LYEGYGVGWVVHQFESVLKSMDPSDRTTLAVMSFTTQFVHENLTQVIADDALVSMTWVVPMQLPWR
jgi:hypothetical protein